MMSKKTKIQYCSDLHLEFPKNSDFLMKYRLLPEGEYLLLAGDITYLGNIYFKHQFFDYISDNFKETYWVPGNHEFYDGFNLSYFDKPIKEAIRKNIWLINNQSVNINENEFFFSTLWGKLEMKYLPFILNGVADFFKIKYNGKLIQREEFEDQHNNCLNFLNRALSESKANKKVVVTHHIPSQQCNIAEFRNSRINSAFVVELEDFIKSSSIDFWVYGHHHRNIYPKKIGRTTLLTNQLGYVHLNEHNDFSLNACFEI